ncbi:hypothetical protein P3L10_003017 [Capsicum annuum]
MLCGLCAGIDGRMSKEGERQKALCKQASTSRANSGKPSLPRIFSIPGLELEISG